MSNRRTVLILGAGIMQLPAIRAAGRLGLHVIVADGNPKAPAIPEADGFAHVDLKDKEGMLEMARALRRESGLDAVFTAATDFSGTVAYVSEALGLPGITHDTALNATDKYRMRSVLKAAGVPVPRFAVLPREQLSTQSVEAACAEVGFPVVVKPADSMGSRGVVQVNDPSTALEQAQASVAHSRTGRVVIEGYIDGPEFSLDALVYGDEIIVTGFADRHIGLDPYFVELGHTIPTAAGTSSQQRITRVFMDAVRALGINLGAAKGDMKMSSAGPVVGEVAARLSGGYMSGWTYPLSTGVPLTENALRIALGDPPGRLKPLWGRTSAERGIISIPGILERIDNIQDARRFAGIEELFVTAVPGDTVKFPTNNVQKLGSLIAVDDDRQTACALAEAAMARILPVLQSKCPETEAFLFGSDAGHWAHVASAAELTDEVRTARPTLRRGSQGPYRTGQSPAPLGTLEKLDWGFRSAEGSISKLEEESRIAVDEQDPIDLAFWRAFYRGGLQGARYYLDTYAGLS